MPRRRSVLIYVVTGIAGLFAILVALVLLMDWDLFKGPIARVVSTRTGRHVAITGHLHAHLWSTTPTLSVEGVQVANPPWEVTRPLLQLKRLQVQIELRPLLTGHLVLRRVEVDQPDLYLHQESSGRANWTNDNTAPMSATKRAAKPFNLPAIHELVIQSGALVLLDDARKLRIRGTIEAHEHSAVEDPKALHIFAQGTINTRPFTLEVTGGALLAVNPEHPYPFKLSIRAADNQIDARGRILKPFDLGQLDLQVAAHGPDLAELYYLTQLALPNTPPYQLQAQIDRDGQHFVVRDIKGTLGRSDIGGNIAIDASHNRPTLTANLDSRHLYLSDLGALTGTRAGAGGALDRSNPAQPAAPVATSKRKPTMLFPDAHLATNRIRAMDADVQFKATSIEAGKVPFTQVSLHAKLKDGVLVLDPLQFVMPEGRVSGIVNIDARQDIPQVHMDVRASDINLAQLKGSGRASAAPLTGILQARAVIKGRGDSVHNVMADADGSFAAVIPHGDIRSAFAELTGIDLSGLGLLLTKNEKMASIRCGLARFDVAQGTAQAQSIVLDTQNVLITGTGNINLGTERLDLTIKGQPKKFHLVRVRAPIDIKGLLTKPSFQPDKGQLLKQGGVAAALGTLLTPVAAIVAFIDPGLAKDQDCTQLLSLTGRAGAHSH
ncbi:MAG TPA: AsmA family protein [Steroidobacteraceae bacterium]